MKKLLLLLLIVLTTNLYATAPPLTIHCGPHEIDLTVHQPYFIVTEDPANTLVTYYTSFADASLDINAITPPTAYFIMTSTVIYVRIQDVLTNAVTFDEFQVILEPAMGLMLSQVGTPTNQIIASVINGASPFVYQWQANGTPFQISGGPIIPIPAAFPGVYTVIVTDANGCQASSSIVVMQNWINASNDALEVALAGPDNSTSTGSVLNNDYIGTAPAFPDQVQLSSNNLPAGFSLNADGTVTVLPGTAAGIYSFTYTVCELLENSCASAMATVQVFSEGFLLRAFIDANSNGSPDVGEQNFGLGQFHYDINDSGTLTDVAAPVGTYLINESNPANSYDLSFTVNSQYAAQYSVTTASYSNVSYVPGSGVTVYYFPITALPYADLAVGLYNFMTPPRPGFTYQNSLYYTNNGTQAMSGTLTFSHDSSVTMVGVSQSGTVATLTGFTFDFTDLQPQETRSILVTMQVPTIPTVSLGQLLLSSATITTPEGDIIPENNQSDLIQPILGSFDPNDKTENHGGKIVYANFTADDYLTYTIRFENTGTYAAENVKVTDILDDQLDETSVRTLTSSHDYSLVREGKNLNWHFNGINLPPSVANTNIGHGYLSFQVKPKPDYAIGDVIPNTASIYFDFNPPIVTEPCVTEFVNALATQGFAFDHFKYSPNPVKNTLTLSNDTIIEKITVTSILGQTVLEQAANNLSSEVDFSSLSSGIYLVKITAQNQQKQIKIAKQ
jgi:uncharacterized repeat protein (TIGR01451 family)